MGAYAEAVRAAFPGALAPPLPADVGWVVLMHDDLAPADVRRLFPAAPRLFVLSPNTVRGADEHEGVGYGRLEGGPPPRLSAAARSALARGYGAAVLLDGLAITSGRVLLELHRLGVRRVAWRSGTGWARGRARVVALRKPVLRLEGRLQRLRLLSWYRRRVQRAAAHSELLRRNRQAFPGEHLWVRHIERQPRLLAAGDAGGRGRASRADAVGDGAPDERASAAGASRVEQPGAGDGRPLSIALYIGQLNSGGAERQLCNLAIGLQRRGHRVRVLTTYPLADENGHYRDDLLAAGVSVGVAGQRADAGAQAALLALGIQPELIGSLPEVIRNPVLDLAGELLADPPDLLHCWLDYPNVIGSAAAALVGLPTVVLSMRNVNPRHFPAFYQPWMDTWYAFFTALPGVHLLANSAAGADDYARWLGLSPARFEVIPNGVELGGSPAPGAEEVAAVRAELGLQPGQPLVAGVFRLAAEKQPVLFLDVIARVRAAVPDLAVALVGVGELRASVEKQVAARYLDGCVRLLGQRKDVGAILRAADVLLLTSAVEGTPNVVLEAQWAGTPPVATAAGGTPDAIEDGVSGCLHAIDDVAGLSRSVVALLQDDARRGAMGAAGRELVARRFSSQRMVEDTVAFYASLLEGEPAEVPLPPFAWSRQAVVK